MTSCHAHPQARELRPSRRFRSAILGAVHAPIDRAREVADAQAGVIARTQLYAAGVTRAEVRAHVRARRWRRVGSQCVSTTTGALTRRQQLWAAVFEAGPRAFLDGAAALEAAGLERFRTDRIR